MIRTEGLSKVYGQNEAEVIALSSLDLEIKAGEMVFVTGPSGSGKSTLLHLMGGLDYPTSGKITIGKEDIFQYKEKDLAKFRRKKIGFVFQAFHLIPELNMKENIVLPVLLDSKKVKEEYICQIAETLGIRDRLLHLPKQLSGGQQQRAAIARALANNPDILLCDEPTGNLDQDTSNEVMGLLREINEKFYKTIVIVTHNMDITTHADRIIRLVDGKLVS